MFRVRSSFITVERMISVIPSTNGSVLTGPITAGCACRPVNVRNNRQVSTVVPRKWFRRKIRRNIIAGLIGLVHHGANALSDLIGIKFRTADVWMADFEEGLRLMRMIE